MLLRINKALILEIAKQLELVSRPSFLSAGIAVLMTRETKQNKLSQVLPNGNRGHVAYEMEGHQKVFNLKGKGSL